MFKYPQLTSKHLYSAIKIGLKISAMGIEKSAHQGDFSKLRKRYDLMGKIVPRSISRTHTVLGQMSATWFTPKKVTDSSVILYCHGGGYCIGSTQSHAALCGLIAKTCQRKVISINYRLAPEHAYPAMIDDGYTAYQALLAEGHSRIILMGDSAGGAMVLSLLQKIRDTGIQPPLCAVAMSPWVDFEMKSPTLYTHKDPILSKEMVATFTKYTFRHNSQKQHSLIYTNFEHLPPILITIAGGDVLEGENLQLATILKTANPTGRIEYWEGMPHVFQALHPLLKEAQLSVNHFKTFIESV